MKTKVSVPASGATPDVTVTSANVSPTAAASALFVSFALLMVGMGVQGALLGVRAELEQFANLWTGLIMTSYFAGLLIGAKLAVRSIAEVGHIRVFAALASMASAAALIHAVAIVPPIWIAMRFLSGVCASGLYVVAESWLNDLTTNATRGRLLAIYMIISMGGYAAGTMLLDTADPRGITLFVVSSVLVSLSLVPVALSSSPAPTISLPDPMGVFELLKTVPTGAISSFFVGSSHGALLGMGAVYATRKGLDPGQVALFMGAPMVGSVVSQFPLGLLSDRVSRRGLMAVVALVATGTAFMLFTQDPGSWTTVALMFMLGGCSFPLYSLGIAYTNDWLEHSQIMAASSTLVFLNGTGAVAGPLFVIGSFAAFGTDSFFLVLMATHGAIGVYIGWRILFRDALPADRQRRWVALSSRSTIVANVIARPRRVRLDADRVGSTDDTGRH